MHVVTGFYFAAWAWLSRVDSDAGFRCWVWQFCRSFLPPRQTRFGDSYRGRENSYTPPSHHGTGFWIWFGRGPPAHGARASARAFARASEGKIRACRH